MLTSARRLLAAITAATSSIAGCAGPVGPIGADPIATICERREAAGELSGRVIVARDGEVIHDGGYGLASFESGTPITDDTRFKIFSTTKQLTAAAVMLLELDGRLSVHDPIREHLPEAPEPWRDVTIHHLLTHTSGVPEFFPALIGNQRRTQLESVLAAFEDIRGLEPATVPGDAFAYSNCAYTVLGALIERVSGMTYAEFLGQRIFGPAGMNGAGCAEPVFVQRGEGEADIGSRVVSRLAAGYNGTPGSPTPTVSNMYIILGAGGVHATATDLLRYDDALRRGDLLPLETQRRMIDQAFENPNGADVGYGWFIRERHGYQLVSHSGGTNGYTCEFARVPDLDLCIVILTNLGYAQPEALRDEILAELLAPAGR